jgi:hypothetical protein
VVDRNEAGLPASLRDRLVLLLGRIHWWVLATAPVITVAIAASVTAGWYAPGKPALETLAVLVTGGFAAACLVRLATSRDIYFLWAAAIMLTLLGREIRLPGASSLVYVALALLGWFALRRLDALGDRLTGPALLTALALGLLTYAISVAVDQRWARGLPGEGLWHVPLEETLELIGHSTIGLALLWSPRQATTNLSARRGSSDSDA